MKNLRRGNNRGSDLIKSPQNLGVRGSSNSNKYKINLPEEYKAREREHKAQRKLLSNETNETSPFLSKKHDGGKYGSIE